MGFLERLGLRNNKEKNLEDGDKKMTSEQEARLGELQTQLGEAQKNLATKEDFANRGHDYSYPGGIDAEVVSNELPNVRKIEQEIRVFCQEIGIDSKEYLEIDRQLEEMKKIMEELQGLRERVEKYYEPAPQQGYTEHEKKEFSDLKEQITRQALHILDLSRKMHENPSRFLNEKEMEFVGYEPEVVSKAA